MSAFERSVDQHNLDATAWVAANLPPDRGVASDFFTGQMMAALGHEIDRKNIADLFLSLQFNDADRLLLIHKRVSFIVVDKRLTQDLPTAGYYFSDDPNRGLYTTPLSSSTIGKFRTALGLSCIYDDGTISIYSVDKGSARK